MSPIKPRKLNNMTKLFQLEQNIKNMSETHWSTNSYSLNKYISYDSSDNHTYLWYQFYYSNIKLCYKITWDNITYLSTIHIWFGHGHGQG
jgi:hypothetical protein